MNGNSDLPGRPRRRRWWLAPAVVLLAWLAAALALDRYGLREPPPGGYDAIIVPGCRVLPDGQPSVALARRTRHAVRLWREGRAPVIVLTGGLGDYPPTEAEAAAAVARNLGVPDSALVLETRSHSTETNAAYAARLVPARRVLAVTDSYHVYRCRMVFRRHFAEADAVGTAPPPYYRLRGALREVLAVIDYGRRGRL